jgi:hypothetical protein
VVIRRGERVLVSPPDWEGREARVGIIENGVLINHSTRVLGFAKSKGVSVEVIDEAEHTGTEFEGDIPVSEVRKCSKMRVGDQPEC